MHRAQDHRASIPGWNANWTTNGLYLVLGGGITARLNLIGVMAFRQAVVLLVLGSLARTLFRSQRFWVDTLVHRYLEQIVGEDDAGGLTILVRSRQGEDLSLLANLGPVIQDPITIYLGV